MDSLATQVQLSLVAMGVLAGGWGVTAYFLYKRARATLGTASTTNPPGEAQPHRGDPDA